MSLSLTLKYLLGKVQSTERIETERASLLHDYKEYVEAEKSDDLKEYFRLKEIVETSEFRNKKKEIQSVRYKGSEESKLEQEFGKLTKNQKLSKYLHAIASNEFKRFEELAESTDIKLFRELDEEFRHAKKNLLKNADDDTAKRYENYQALIKNESVIFYHNYLNSSDYRNYQVVKDSEMLKRYFELEKILHTDEYKKKKEWLLDSERYEKTEEFKMEQVYNRIKSLPQVTLYLKYQNTNRFDELKKWKLTFEDDFNSSSLDLSLWSANNAIPGEPFMAPYSQEDDMQAYTSGKNISQYNSILKLEVRKENAEGKKLTR
ncbi:MAG: hypothetical protein Q8862_13430, partial [Bacteroidota bacterium]|nr:hypothetical protein [Bacteroidota bacterium]